MAKTSKSSNNNKKKKSSARPNSISMKLKSQKSTVEKQNPFETIWCRRKFDIVGKKRKGEERRIGQARSLAIEKRKKTLLKEYQQSGKASSFDDKRIGELDEGLPEFDKAILRSQRERQKKLKTSKYNLSDGEEDELGINDGQWDDFNENFEGGSDDENMEHNDDGFGSGFLNRHKNLKAQPSADGDSAEREENRHKSKKEIMEEVIQKSKFFRAEKAKEKEENEQLVGKLDKDFESLVQSQAFSSLTQPNKMNALKALVSPTFSKEPKNQVKSVSVTPTDGPDQYDKLVNEMMLEIRARPSDRTKTPEEIAEEEKERLEHLEQERQNRMNANDEGSDDEQEDLEGVVRPSANKMSHISGDDLGDSFTVAEKPQNKKGWVDEILERDDAEDSDNDVDSDDSGDSEDTEGGSEDDVENNEKGKALKDWEQSDDDFSVESEDEEDESDEEAEAENGKTHQKPERNDKVKKSTVSNSIKAIGDTKQSSCLKQELPFKIDAPTSVEELNKLFGNLSNEDIVEAIRRIRVCNAIALAAENRKKMQVFYGLLLQYFATLASQRPLKFQLINLLVKPLMEMSAEIPYFSAICARERIQRTRMKFCEDIKVPDKSCWPSLKTMLLLRLWSMIFPCSDFRHAVMTPAILLMCEHLMRCPVLSVRDAAIGSFLCSLVLSVTKQSQKFCPEALIFLKSLLLTAMHRDQCSKISQKFHHLFEVKEPLPLLCIKEHVEEIQPLDFLKIMNLPEDSSFFDTDDMRASVLMSVVETLDGFVKIYGDLKAFPETFLPISELLTEVAHQKNLPHPLQEKLKNVANQITSKADEHHNVRRPLQMRKQKPVPIKLLNPKFEENFIAGKSYDPNRERAEKRKIAKEYRQEARGAKRELRKDNYFLLEVKEKERKRAEQEKAEKNGKNIAFLQEIEHAFKSGQLGKNRKRRR